MKFLPTKKVFRSLIKFATRLKDPLVEINHKEEKTDPRIRDIEKNYKGIDMYFNSLRVLPPESLDYPDFERDGDEFYDKIGSHALKRKYAKDPGAACNHDLDKIKTLGGLINSALLNKGETVQKVQDNILAGMTFKVWERFTKDLGKHETDPTRPQEKGKIS
jgi:hypothetical protein